VNLLPGPATDPDVVSRDDELLVIRCQLGEPEAFDALVLRWHPSLSRYIKGLLPNDNAADDVVQELWMSVLRGIPRLREPGALAPWLFSIARRAVMTRLRQRYATAVEVPFGMSDDVSAPDVPVDPAEDDWPMLERHLDKLAVAEREVLVLFYLKEMSLQDLSTVLAIPVGTVKSRLHRARRQLRALVGEEA
jgi:RNA polymerase sigma factor (sigma-70 family)